MKRAAKASTRTSVQTIPIDRRGFTLLEVIVVVALIAIVATFALPRISSYAKLSLDASGREMGTVLKEAYNAAVITGRVYRLVYDLKEGTYWAEAGPPDLVLDTEESREARLKKLGSSRFEAAEKKRAPSFRLDKDITRAKKSLPQGVTYEDVLTEQGDKPVKTGLAYTHIFPHGQAEQTLIHLKDEAGHHSTLVVSPILGKARVFNRYVDRKEAETL